jgi:16S rRNA (uracil1498-N3)-methyltransferase
MGHTALAMSLPRFFVDAALRAGSHAALPPNAARHVQVLRLQPDDAVCLFDGRGGQWQGKIVRIGRSEVRVRVGEHLALDCELQRAVSIAVGMPANERMDSLIEKATELGVAAIQPLHCERSVLRVAGERVQRKAAHWRAIAAAACEQCGRNRLPELHEPLVLRDWLDTVAGDSATHVLLRPGDAPPLAQTRWGDQAVVFLSGPEGGLTAAEEAAAQAAGFVPRSLGPRVLRADTAPMAALAWIGLQ